jgi:hypothetical protein
MTKDLININTILPEKIKNRMVEMERGIAQFCTRNSQTSTSLMTLNMIDSGPYRILRQILAQINTKRSALIENCYRIKKRKIQLNELLEKQEINNYLTELEELKIAKYRSDITLAEAPLQATIREIGALQERYYEVLKNKNIPENWTEDNFEEAEIEHHIKSIFRNAIRDRMAGNHNMGTMEYMEQFGIEPIGAYALVDAFIIHVRNTKGIPDIQARYEFYDKMFEQYRGEPIKAAKRLGLDSITYAEWLLKQESK